MDEGRVEVTVGLGEELVSKYAELSEAVLLPCRHALDDVHTGLDTMCALGALGVGLFATSRLLHSIYWWAEHDDTAGASPSKAARRKQLAALSIGSVVVSGLCYAGMLATRGQMLRPRNAS